MNGRNDRFGWLALALLLAGAAPVRAQQAPAAAPRTAVLVYVAWQELEGDLLDARALRERVTLRLSAAAQATGRTVVAAEELEPLVARWRIRGGQMVHDEFLADVRDGAGAQQLLVGELYLLADRLLLAWRLTDTASGLLAGAGFAEAPLALPEEPKNERGPRRRARATLEAAIGTGPWLEAAGRLDADLTAAAAPARGPVQPVVLPLQAIGSETGAAALATHALLVDLVQEGAGPVPDPALAASALRRAGWRPDQMSAAVRTLLRDRFGAQAAWTGQLVTYEVAESRAAPVTVDIEEFAASPAGALDDFALSLTRVDLADGRIMQSDEMYENRAVDEGWFGSQTRHPLLDRLRATVAELRRGVNR